MLYHFFVFCQEECKNIDVPHKIYNILYLAVNFTAILSTTQDYTKVFVWSCVDLTVIFYRYFITIQMFQNCHNINFKNINILEL